MMLVGAAHPLNREGLAAAAEHVGIHPTVLWSVVAVETSGCGFLPDRRPAILFERHIFSRRGVFDLPSRGSINQPDMPPDEFREGLFIASGQELLQQVLIGHIARF